MDEKTHKPESARLRRWAVVAELPNGETILAPGRYEGKAAAELCAMICVERYKRKFSVVEVAEPDAHSGALDNSRESSSLQRAGSPALTWIAGPTRAGWWWWENYSDPVNVFEHPHHGRLVFRHPLPFTPDELTEPVTESGRWSGPIERPQAPDEATPENSILNEPRSEK